MPPKIGNEGILYLIDSYGNQQKFGEIKEFKLDIKPQQSDKDLLKWKRLKTKRLRKKYYKKLIEKHENNKLIIEVISKKIYKFKFKNISKKRRTNYENTKTKI